jgi:hypothetical protein
VPDHVPNTHRVINVKCVNCGHNIYREFNIRKPNRAEKAGGLKGVVGTCPARTKGV